MTHRTFTIRNRDAWLICPCGHQTCIASGYCALKFDDAFAVTCGVLIGWQMSPEVKCPKCKEKNGIQK